jgi:hypothetical protein
MAPLPDRTIAIRRPSRRRPPHDIAGGKGRACRSVRTERIDSRPFSVKWSDAGVPDIRKFLGCAGLTKSSVGMW